MEPLKTNKRICNHKITNSYGAYDYFKFYRKHKPKDKEYVISEGDYYKLIRGINEKLSHELVEHTRVKFPHNFGSLYISKKKSTVDIVDDKLIINKSVNWLETRKLWKEDPSLIKKSYIYFDSKYIYTIKYNKFRINIPHAKYLSFKKNATLVKKLADKLKEGEYETFITK